MAKLEKSSPAKRAPTGDLNLGRHLKAARNRAGINQEKLASLAGVTKGLISQFETGDTLPSVSVLAKMGEILKCGVDALLYGPNAARFRQSTLPGMSLDDRINALPEGLREFVILALKRAEHAQKHIPAQFINPPTSENWPQFAAYLEAISMIGAKD